MSGSALIFASVHALETASSTDSEQVCESPLCDIRFPQTGLAIEPRRFCSSKCRQQTSILRRAANLLQVLPIAHQMDVLLSFRKPRLRIEDNEACFLK